MEKFVLLLNLIWEMMRMILDILIGLITVTFINCSALCGAVILPFRKRAAFKWILTGFIGLGKERLFSSMSYSIDSFQLLEH